MRRLPLIALTILALAAQARAQDTPRSIRGGVMDETRAAANALAQTLGSEGTMRHMLDVLRNQIQTSITARNPGADVKKALDDIIMPALQRHLGELNTSIAELWTSHLSLMELKELRAFYETPLGRKAFQVLPQIMAESQTAGNKWARDVFRDIIAKHADELKALGITPTQP